MLVSAVRTISCTVQYHLRYSFFICIVHKSVHFFDINKCCYCPCLFAFLKVRVVSVCNLPYYYPYNMLTNNGKKTSTFPSLLKVKWHDAPTPRLRQWPRINSILTYSYISLINGFSPFQYQTLERSELR